MVPVQTPSAQQIVLYEPETAGLMRALGHLGYGLRVALIESGLMEMVADPAVAVVVFGPMRDTSLVPDLIDRVRKSSPKIGAVVVGDNPEVSRGALTGRLSWPLPEDTEIRRVLTKVLRRTKREQDAPPTISVDWESLSSITRSGFHANLQPGPLVDEVSNTPTVPADVLDREHGSEAAVPETVSGLMATPQATASTSAEGGDDPWEAEQTSSDLEAELSNLGPEESFERGLAEIGTILWALRDASNSAELSELPQAKRRGLAKNADILSRLLSQLGTVLCTAGSSPPGDGGDD